MKTIKFDLGKRGIVEINKIEVTGILYRNSKKRFKLVYDVSEWGLKTAFMINLWNGSRWGIGASTGKRILLQRVKN